MSYNFRRIFAGLIWAPTAFILLSHFVGYDWLGEYEQDAVTISFVLLVISVLFIGPSLSDMRQRKGEKRDGSKPET